MTIAAIPTKYSGVLFRSRLEARWAVFFDALGIKWQYEAEGYQLKDGTRYLPDFRLAIPGDANTHHAFVEIKPLGDKSTSFARETPDTVLELEGDPSDCRISVAACCFGQDRCGLVSAPFYLACRFGTAPVDLLNNLDESVSSAIAQARGYRFWDPDGTPR